MDFSILTARLIEAQDRKTERLSPVLRGTARTHFRLGVQECLRALQEQALAEEQAGGAVMSAPQPMPLTGPLAVQASHSAQEESGEV